MRRNEKSNEVNVVVRMLAFLFLLLFFFSKITLTANVVIFFFLDLVYEKTAPLSKSKED